MSRGFKRATSLVIALFSSTFFIFSPILSYSTDLTGRRVVLLIELSQKEIEKEVARAYFKSLEGYFRENFELEPVVYASPVIGVEAYKPLLKVPSKKLYLWNEKLLRGKKLLRYLEVDRGLEELEELNESPYLYELEGRSMEIVEEALLASSFILFKTGRIGESGRLIKRYLGVSGTREIESASYPPDFVSFFGEIISGPIHTSLAINSTPPGAEVLVNGRSFGRTPLLGSIEVAGNVSISIIKDGYLEETGYRTAYPGDRISMERDLKIDPVEEIRKVVDGDRYEEAGYNISKLIENSGLDGGLVIVLKGEDLPRDLDFIFLSRDMGENDLTPLILKGIEIDGGAFNGEDVIPLMSYPSFSNILPEGALEAHRATALKRKKVTEKWWFWAIIGVGAAGVAYGILKGGDQQSGGTVTVEF